MRYLIFIISMVFISLNSFSQIDERIFLNNHIGIEYSASYPLQSQEILKPYDELYSNIKVKIPSQMGSKFGLNYYFYLNEHIGFQSGVKYLFQKYYFSFTGDFYDFYENDFRLLEHNILEFPLSVKVNIPSGNNYFDIGLGISYLHFINNPDVFEADLINTAGTDTFKLKTIPANNINPFFYDFSVALNVVQESKNILRIGLYYQNSIKNKRLNTVEFYSYPDNNLLYSSQVNLKGYFGLSVSYTFSFTNRLEKYIEEKVKEREKKIKGVIDM